MRGERGGVSVSVLKVTGDLMMCIADSCLTCWGKKKLESWVCPGNVRNIAFR